MFECLDMFGMFFYFRLGISHRGYVVGLPSLHTNSDPGRPHMSALVIDQLTSKSEINDHTHLSRYKLNENKHRQVGVLSSNLILKDLHLNIVTVDMGWFAPHQAWYLAECYVPRETVEGYRQNIRPQCVSKSGKNNISIASPSVQYSSKGMAIPFTLAL